MKKTIALMISLILILSTAATVYGTGYTDIKIDNWAYDAVNTMSSKEIVKGYPDGSFKPNNTVTYGEFIKMALIAATGEDVGNANSGNWSENYYNKALELKYFTGYDIDKSQLGDKITRAHMALIISSILGDVKIDNYDEIQKGITDITYQTEYEYAITKAYAYGILTGYTDDTFRPDKTLSRAESATVIYRLVDESKRVYPASKENAVTDSAVTVPIYKTNGLLDMSKLTQDKIVTKNANFTDTYEFYTDASVWDIKMFRSFNGESCAFDTTLKGFIYLVKDGVIVDYCQTGPMYDDEGINYLGYQRSRAEYDITKADYIMSVPTQAADDSQLIKMVVNPFKI